MGECARGQSELFFRQPVRDGAVMGWRKRERKRLVAIARLEEQRRSEKFARKLQRREMERRLEALNHEAARIKEAADHSVSRELFDAKLSEVGRWQGAVSARMAAWAGGGAVLAFLLNRFLYQ